MSIMKSPEQSPLQRWVNCLLHCPLKGGVYGCLHQQPFHHQLLVCRHIAIAQTV